jgi:hypothetical protein
MLRADPRTETLRRAGLFGGAAFFGFWCTDWIQHYAHPGARIGIWSLRPWWLFAAFGVYGALVLHDRFLKAASIVFAVQNLATSISLRRVSALAADFSNVLIVAFALLLVVAGARHRTRKEYLLAIVAFAGAIVFSFGVKEYAREVNGGRSVIHEQGISR